MSDIPVIKTKEDAEPFIMVIPECCREGLDSCPHVVNRKTIPKRGNIAL